jgi:hypothetical protein
MKTYRFSMRKLLAVEFTSCYNFCGYYGYRGYFDKAGVAQSVCLTTEWTTGVRSPAEAKDFSSSLCVQTSSEAHPTSHPLVPRVLFLGVKLGLDVTTHPI